MAAFRQTVAEHGTLTFVGFAYPPSTRQALALVQSTTGDRGAIESGVSKGGPARIEFFELQAAPPTIVPKGRFWGWFDVAGLVLIDAVHPAYHQRRLAMLKPRLPPEVWEALRQDADFRHH